MAVADYIRSMDVDILACEEVNPTGDKSGNGTSDRDDLLAELGSNYSERHGTTGGTQKLAFIRRNDRVTVTDVSKLKGFQREAVTGTTKKTFPRIPLTAYVKSKQGGVDFRIIVVHLFWICNTCRYQEGRALQKWAKDYLEGSSDKDALLIADFNTKSLSGDPSDSTNDGDSKTANNIKQGGSWIWVSGWVTIRLLPRRNATVTPLPHLTCSRKSIEPPMFAAMCPREMTIKGMCRITVASE